MIKTDLARILLPYQVPNHGLVLGKEKGGRYDNEGKEVFKRGQSRDLSKRDKSNSHVKQG